MAKDQVADAIDRAFSSPNVLDSNLEAANIVDVINQLAFNAGKIAKSIETLAAAVASLEKKE